jgi:hypothetical protein
MFDGESFGSAEDSCLTEILVVGVDVKWVELSLDSQSGDLPVTGVYPSESVAIECNFPLV